MISHYYQDQIRVVNYEEHTQIQTGTEFKVFTNTTQPEASVLVRAAQCRFNQLNRPHLP